MGFNNLWIHFIFREFNCFSIYEICSPLYQMESWARCLGGRIFFLFQRKLFILFRNSKNLTHVPQFGWEGLVIDYVFPSQTESHTLPDMNFFYYTFTFFVRFGVIEVNSKCFNGNFDHLICPGWLILFLYAPAHKVWLFEKCYLWARFIFI